MNVVLIVAIVVILYIYVSYFYRFPESVKILNAYSDSFNTALMLEKQPIVIIGSTLTLPEFKDATVPYLLTKRYAHTPAVWFRNRTKYLLIRTDEETELHLLPPAKKLTTDNIPADDETLITLQIKPTQIVILPFKWLYYAETQLDMLGVNDYISWALL